MLAASSLLVIAAVLWTAHYLRTAVRMPALHYNSANADIVRKLPQLHEPYRPTPWLYNRHLQIAGYIAREHFAPRLRYERSDTLVMDDGGTTSLEWLGLHVRPSTPTIVVLHTISGDAQSIRSIVVDLHRQTGWRVVVCTRRGHGGLRVTAPRFNTMGSTSDLRQQLEHIRSAVPESPLYGVGVSAGSGLLTRYLGEEGEASLLRAGAIYCPGYDIAVAFQRAHAFYSRQVTRTLKRQFVAPHAELFGHLATYQACLAASTLADFQEHAYEIAGFTTHAEYLEHSNPMGVVGRIAVPVLVINSDDDPVCHVDNVIEHSGAVERLQRALLVRTSHGSHCSHFEGWTARSWSHRLIAGYLTAVHECSA